MMKHKIVFVLLVAVFSGLLIGCYSSSGQTEKVQFQANSQTAMLVGDEELTRLVLRFASSDNTEALKAWEKLNSYPRQQLIERLLQISSSLQEDDRRQVLIAFVLCNLDYEYQKNRAVVISSLSEKQRYQGFYSDWAASLINRLIERGDKDLLSSLFASTQWADGALASSLSGYLVKNIKNDPNVFLFKLKSEPKEIRRNVYELFTSDEMLTQEDMKTIKTYLQSVPQDSELFQISNEMLKAIGSKG